MPLSTHMAERYRLHLIHLRTLAYHHLEGAELAEMQEAIEDLADTLMAGGPTVVQVEIDVPPADQVAEGIEAARAELGVTSLLDDTAAAANSDRDHRVAS
jgi:hypothetical protein